MQTHSTLKKEAAAALVKRLHGPWTSADQAALDARLASDPAYAQVWERAQESFREFDAYGKTSDGARWRNEALTYAWQPGSNRWWRGWGEYRHWRLAAGLAGLTVALAAAWQFSPWGYRPDQYHTGIGEQRVVDLDDHSRIALDARTKVAVHYTSESRTIELIEGQAQFSVAKDPARPFKVKAGDRTVIALSTVFTVEYADREVHVATLEGRVAVMPQSTSKAVELSAGEALDVSQDRRVTVVPHADLEAATAWRSGRLVFKGETLGAAVRRVNRYSRVQITVDDPSLAQEPINGMFDTGDTAGFVTAIQLALPIAVDWGNPRRVRFLPRKRQ